MIGTVTWVGQITCNDCPEQITEIQWGETRKILKRAGWREHAVNARRVWCCPSCHKKREEMK